MDLSSHASIHEVLDQVMNMFSTKVPRDSCSLPVKRSTRMEADIKRRSGLSGTGIQSRGKKGPLSGLTNCFTVRSETKKMPLS